MRTKGNQDEEEYGEDEFGSKRDGPSSNSPPTTANDTNTANKDGKNSDRASAIRSKHSVTEQRRRSKINERFQILRELIPNSEQKRDTASFLLEVIDYVQFLQEKVQKYEGSYPGWSAEPTKLMPWRNSHWRAQGFASHPQAVTNGSGPGTPYPGKFEENSMVSTPAVLTATPNPVVSDLARDVPCHVINRQPESESKELLLPMPLQPNTPVSVPSTQPPECAAAAAAAANDSISQQDDLVIEGGTISISSVYSQELLSSLTQALEKTGIDLSQAKISVQIDLAKRTNRDFTSGASSTKEMPNPSLAALVPGQPSVDTIGTPDSDQARKRLKR